jgi:hypothetical protein
MRDFEGAVGELGGAEVGLEGALSKHGGHGERDATAYRGQLFILCKYRSHRWASLFCFLFLQL